MKLEIKKYGHQSHKEINCKCNIVMANSRLGDNESVEAGV
jgi:hypothetical protein